MKKNLFSFLLFIFLSFIISCASNKNEDVKENVSEPVENEKTEEVTPVNDAVETLEEVQIFEDDMVESVDEIIYSEDDDEYLRSTEELGLNEVSKEEFSEDKNTILQIIHELSEIMERKDTNAWLAYIDEESKKYYSAPANIRKAQKKLPDKTLQLHGIGDYFKYVFIPSRKRSQVDEIRYISKTNIKAVEVKEDNSVIIYYYFVKENGEWLVHIPPLS